MAGTQEAKDKYLKEKVDTVLLRVPKGYKSVMQEYAKNKNKSLNAFILELVQREISDNSK